MDAYKLNAREMSRARKDMFFGCPKEEVLEKANDIQRVSLHHIQLLSKSFDELEVVELLELMENIIKWKEAKASKESL